MFVEDELSTYDAIGLADLIKNHEITAAELTEIVIARIERLNPVLNFMTNVDFERARRRAQLAQTDSAFAGVPFLIKDMIDVAGLPRTDGSKLMLNNVPVQNVKYIDAVEQAGLNILGMTNVPEFATGITTDNELFGATRNPWNTEFSVFSSSGGSATAVAAGVVSMAHGTDGGGSNRLPASATGILGLKPSRGRMLSGEADNGHDIAKTNHVLSRSVHESALLFSLTEDHCGPLPPVGYIRNPSRNRLRIGTLDNKLQGEHEADVREALSQTSIFLADLGHEIVETEFPVNRQDFTRAYTAFFSSRLTPLRALIKASTGQSIGESGLVTPFVASGAEVLANISAQDIEDGMVYLRSLGPIFADFFADIDLLLTPVSHIVCPAADCGLLNESWTDEIAEDAIRHLQYTAPVNFAGCPAMSVPLSTGHTSKLPVGSHLIAPVGQEQKLFEVAYELEAATNWMDRFK